MNHLKKFYFSDSCGDSTLTDQSIREVKLNDEVNKKYQKIFTLNKQDENLSEPQNKMKLVSNLGCNHSLKKVSFLFVI